MSPRPASVVHPMFASPVSPAPIKRLWNGRCDVATPLVRTSLPSPLDRRPPTRSFETRSPPARHTRHAPPPGGTPAPRIALPPAAPSRLVAAALAERLAAADVIWCGDYSFDRGTGS